MPTKIPFALKADGSVIAPTDWAMTIGDGSPHVKVSGFHIDGFPAGVTINGETDQCATWSNRGHETAEGDGSFILTGEEGGKVSTTGGTEDDPLCWTYGPTMHGKKGITWNLIGVDGNRGLLDGAANGETGVGTVSITVEAVKPQTFAVISDDGQMNFYHRVRVPSVGEEYDGLKIKHIYAGLDNLTVEKTTDDWFEETDAPWYGERNEPTSVKVVDDGVAVGRFCYLCEVHTTEVVCFWLLRPFAHSFVCRVAGTYSPRGKFHTDPCCRRIQSKERQRDKKARQMSRAIRPRASSYEQATRQRSIKSDNTHLLRAEHRGTLADNAPKSSEDK